MKVRTHQQSGVLATRVLSLLIALALSCVSSGAVNASDGGNSSKGGDVSPGSSGLEDGYLEIEKTRLHVVRGGAGQQRPFRARRGAHPFGRSETPGSPHPPGTRPS